jgi:hypothetical protein
MGCSDRKGRPSLCVGESIDDDVSRSVVLHVFLFCHVAQSRNAQMPTHLYTAVWCPALLLTVGRSSAVKKSQVTSTALKSSVVVVIEVVILRIVIE